jgi:HEPN domain-containing protein
MRFDPQADVEFRIKLAREYFEDAEARLKGGDFRGCVQYSQLAAENAAKAVIATKRVPSWTHDPSAELLQLLGDFPPEKRERISRLAEISSKLAPEHGRTTYGEPEKFLTPKMLYDQNSAKEALELAREALRLMSEILG